MPPLCLPDQFAALDVEGGKQGGGAVAGIIVRAAFDLSGTQGQQRGGSVQRLAGLRPPGPGHELKPAWFGNRNCNQRTTSAHRSSCHAIRCVTCPYLRYWFKTQDASLSKALALAREPWLEWSPEQRLGQRPEQAARSCKAYGCKRSGSGPRRRWRGLSPRVASCRCPCE